jgi:hypothetical protein
MLCAEAYESLASTPEPEQPSTPPSIGSIRELAELTVLELEASEVVTTEVTGYTGSTSAIVQVHGTITLGVDLNEARYIQVDVEQRRLVLSLPQPEVRRVAIDPNASRTLRCGRSGLWQLAVGSAHEDTVVTEALVIGRDRLSQAASHEDMLRRAQRQTEAVLIRFVSEMGWTIEVAWDE